MATILATGTTQTVFLGLAVVGGSILTIQTIMLLIGLDGDVDVDADAGDGLGFVSIRTLSSLLATFGLVGWWAMGEGYTVASAAGMGLAAGLVVMVLVAWLFSLQSKLHQDGTLNSAQAVGLTATVYLVVPGQGAGKGKITVNVQGRSHEFTATTQGDTIPTGQEVRIVRQITENTFEVEPI